MSKKLNIFKIGGKVINEPEQRLGFLHSFSRITGHKILVHGGGNKATELSKKLGIPTKMFEGRRITDEATLDVALMVYAGLINKQIVAQLQALSVNATGLTGADQNSLLAKKRDVGAVDFGFVGDIVAINIEAIRQLLDNAVVPVFCAITHDKNGQLLNTNADHIAASIAGAMATEFDTDLYFCFEKKGVLSDPADEDSVLEQINTTSYLEHKKTGVISDGMIPKLDNAFAALEKGVKAVYICNAQAIAAQSMKNATTLCL